MHLSIVLFLGNGPARIAAPPEPGLLPRCLRAACSLRPAELFVAVPWLPGWPAPPPYVLPEREPGRGPLAGLVQGLAAMSAPWLLALQPDFPWPAERLLPRLAAQCRHGCGVVPQWRQRPEPLAAFYPRQALPVARAFLAEGCYDLRHLAEWLAALGLVRLVDVPPGRARRAGAHPPTATIGRQGV